MNTTICKLIVGQAHLEHFTLSIYSAMNMAIILMALRTHSGCLRSIDINNLIPYDAMCDITNLLKSFPKLEMLQLKGFLAFGPAMQIATRHFTTKRSEY